MYGQIPYMMVNPYQYAPASSILGASRGLSGFLGKINFSSILTKAGKALNVANQAIPLYRQVKPMINNINTIGKIGREFNKMGNSSIQNNNVENNEINNTITDNISENINNNIPTPTFFL